ncbi:MAG TPA: 50S ribosomal protein L37 [Nitrososphaeraceae archaeon]
MVRRKRQGRTALKGLGVKFGVTVRKRYGMVYRTLKQKRRCPSCASLKFGRVAAGIWYCRKCNYKVAGGAYSIDTEKLQS